MNINQALQILDSWGARVDFNRGTVDVTVWRAGKPVNVWAGNLVEAVEKLKIELNK